MKCIEIIQLVAVGHAWLHMNQSPNEFLYHSVSTSESCSPSWSSFGAVPEFQEPLVEEAFKETFSLIRRNSRVSWDLCNIWCEACPPAPKIAELDTKTDPRLSCWLCWWAQRNGCLERSGREATRLSSICPWELPLRTANTLEKLRESFAFFLFRGLLNAVPLEPRLGLPEKIFVRPSCTDYTQVSSVNSASWGWSSVSTVCTVLSIGVHEVPFLILANTCLVTPHYVIFIFNKFTEQILRLSNGGL